MLCFYNFIFFESQIDVNKFEFEKERRRPTEDNLWGKDWETTVSNKEKREKKK